MLILLLILPCANCQSSISNVSIQITSPHHNQVINDDEVLVEGTSFGLKNSNLNIYILVHPYKCSKTWWVQWEPTPRLDGSWSGYAALGKPREYYDIRVIITKEDLPTPDKGYKDPTITDEEFPPDAISCEVNHIYRTSIWQQLLDFLKKHLFEIVVIVFGGILVIIRGLLKRKR